MGYQVGTISHEALPVTLWWLSLAYANRDDLVEVSLVDDAGNVRAIWLGYPVNGRYPTRAWEPGEVVEDTVIVPLNGLPAGRYRLGLKLIALEETPGADWTPVDVRDLPVVAAIQLEQIQIPNMAENTAATAGDRPAAGLDDRRAESKPTFTLRAMIRIRIAGLSSDHWRQVALVGPDNQRHPPLAVADDVVFFLVGGAWQSGDYRLCVQAALDRCSSQALLTVKTRPRSFEAPSAGQHVDADFGDQIQLVSYELPMRTIEPGGSLGLSLYWQGLRTMGQDYLVTVKLLNAVDNQLGGQLDRIPQGHYSTLLWLPGEVVADTINVPIFPDAQPGVYRLEVGVYREVDGHAQHLPLVVDGIEQPANMVNLADIRVGGPPPGVTVDHPQPEFPRDDRLGETISLIGYDLQPEPEALSLTFYWRCDQRPAQDYTTFVHVLPARAGVPVVAQMDSPPAGGAYPTSLWQPGEVIRDTITVPMPPDLAAGNYEIVVGLYDPISGQRLPVAGAADAGIHLPAIAWPPSSP